MKDWLDRGEAILVDVREEDEHGRERIRGARLLPLSRLDRSAVPHEPGKALVLQCNSGNRSAKAAARIALPEGARRPLTWPAASSLEAGRAAGAGLLG